MANNSSLAELETELQNVSGVPLAIIQSIKNLEGMNNDNRYACVLYVLINGYDSQNRVTFEFNGQTPVTTDARIYDEVANKLPKQFVTANNYPLIEYLKKMPGWQQMTQGYDTPIHNTKVGVWGFQLPATPNSPVTGPNKNVPPLCEQALNKIHPDFTKNLEGFCNLIRTRAYLALPAMAFGSLAGVVKGITGVVVAFQRIVNSIYQGVLTIIQEWYAYINGILVEIQKWMMWVIEQIIPIDLICLILESVQVLLDDINFFTSLFSQSGSIFNYLNQIQNYINVASNFLLNPLTTVISSLPPEVTEIINLVNQIGTDPNGFIVDQLSNYGYYYVAEALQGNLIAALVDKYGQQYRAIGPVSNFINNSGLLAPTPYFPPTPASIGPSWNYGSDDDPVTDTNQNPINTTARIVNRTQKQLNDSINQLGESFAGIFQPTQKVPTGQ